MRVSAFQSVFFCATAALVAFSIGILVARGGAPLKLGPSGDDQGVAHPKTVRVILPDTLDGQSIPGHGTGLVDRRRDLSPLYPTSPGPHEDRSTSTMAAGTAKSPGARDGDDLNPVKASALANETGQPQARDEEGLPDPAADADIPIPTDPRFLRHVPLGSRHASGNFYRHYYLAARRGRPLYRNGAFARLSTSDHGR